MEFERDLNLEATELRLGLPGTGEITEKQTSNNIACGKSNKRSIHDITEESKSTVSDSTQSNQESTPPTKAQVVGWPPVRSYRKNAFQAKKTEPEAVGNFVKVSMDGAPYLRKIDLNIYKGYSELLKALEDMFKFKVGKYSEREGIMGQNMNQHMRIKMEIGCWLGMYHGRCSSVHARD